MTEKAHAEEKSQWNKHTFIKELFMRRVPQYMGGYLAGSWIIVEFMDWLVNRYPLSPYLVEFVLITLATMIPTVVLLAYFHGKPGKDSWNRVEKIGIPANVVAAVTLMILLFNGKELGATTTTVTLVDENGEQVERLIPKSEFRKKVAFFPFENETGDTAKTWLQHALPDMIQYDLSQDIYLEISSPYNAIEGFKEARLQINDRIPLTLQRKIAGELHMDYFASGIIQKQDGQLSATISLYDTKNAKRISEHTIHEDDIFALVDRISDQIKDDLEIPSQHVEKTDDLPVSEILTSSEAALQEYYAGLNIVAWEDDWYTSIEYLQRSVQQDATFAIGYLNLYMLYTMTNQSQKVIEVFQPLMQHLYKLPERIQFAIKHDYYHTVKQQPEMAFNVARNWVELYPDDLTGHNILALLLVRRNQIEEGIAEYKKILSLDPKQYELLLEIGSWYSRIGNNKEAEKYYQDYVDAFPNSVRSYLEMGGFMESTGEYEQAKSNYNKALLIEPDNVSILISLANIESELGSFEASLEQLHEALALSTSPQEKYEVYTSLEYYYQLRGQRRKSIEFMEMGFTELEKYAPPLMVVDKQSESLGKYIRVGNNDMAFQIAHDTEEAMGPPLDKMIPLLYLDIYLALEDVENAETALTGVEEAIQMLQVEILWPLAMEARGEIHELKGEYELAIESYLKQLELEPTSSNIYVDLGRCYRNIQDFKNAEESLQKTLAIHPYWPVANYEMALVCLETGRTEEARKHLGTALKVWENADEEFETAVRAQDKLLELEAFSSQAI